MRLCDWGEGDRKFRPVDWRVRRLGYSEQHSGKVDVLQWMLDNSGGCFDAATTRCEWMQRLHRSSEVRFATEAAKDMR